jgi:hypothetical protein
MRRTGPNLQNIPIKLSPESREVVNRVRGFSINGIGIDTPTRRCVFGCGQVAVVNSADVAICTDCRAYFDNVEGVIVK